MGFNFDEHFVTDKDLELRGTEVMFGAGCYVTVARLGNEKTQKMLKKLQKKS